MKKKGSNIILQPENLHLWHFQFLFEAVAVAPLLAFVGPFSGELFIG